MWVFGYGSLLWNPNFPYVQKIPGVVTGYARRFWQLSPDHRGTPEKPGRTVTLVPDKKSYCWGLAFQVAEDQVAATRQYLDFREKAGYSLTKMLFKPDDSSIDPFEVEAYVSDCNGEHYAGPTDLEDICQTIIGSEGPSGSNIEYALLLADTLHKQAPHAPDQHVFDVERRVLELCSSSGTRKDVLSKMDRKDERQQ
ncbi:hypothetical protein RB195_012598 [Necator americanus]|uniref:glutathione-specific gamma-glutamylcyclotransferase n=1 Tax=Necator americanus TaxID=51031 RepID=A0ABR1DT52_NECAM